MSDINVSVLDQQLQLTSTPTVAAQGVNEDYIVFDFLDNSWSGFSMVALFFAEDNPEAVYQSVVNSAGRALVPWEATQTDGAMYFGLAGVNGNIRYTSELVRYKIVAGLYEGAESVEPTPSVYEQWAAAVSEYAANVADLTGDVAELSERLDIAEALQTDTMSGSKIVTYTSDALTAQYDSALQQYYVEYAVALPAGASVLETAWSRGASDVWQQSDLRTTMSASTATVRHTLEAQAAYTFKIRVTISYPESADLAELQDIRVGADGTVYASAGAAVRAQAMQLDSTLTEAGKAADAKATGDAIADLKDDISAFEDDLSNIGQIVDSIVPGLSEDAKRALLNCFQNVAWANGNGQSYYNLLHDTLYAESGLVRITAVFAPGASAITTKTPINDLKAYLTVTGYYDDGTSKTIIDYALVGELATGLNTITVYYNNISTTFTVNAIGIPSGYMEREAVIAGAIDASKNVNEVETEYYINSSSRILAKCKLNFEFVSGNNGTCSLFTDHSADGYGFSYSKTLNLHRKKYSTYRGGSLYTTPLEGEEGAIAIDETVVYEFDIFPDNTIKRDGVTILNGTVDGDKTSGKHMCILGDMQSGSELYYLKVFEGESLVGYYMPCVRESDGLVGIYDIVGGKFFGNANWTAK